ncbi:MAG: Lrp/AsnC family transcriptional regulator [Nitrososphaeria archaeon]|nr:Lrp/AsnC family transcriptional regulator [Nitrososphaeria archaeon]
MDKVDEIIIESLLKNARTSKVELARRLKITEAAIRKRLKKLESYGIILGYKAIVDYQKIGYTASLTGIDTVPEKLWKVIEKLKMFNEIKSVMLTSGDHMILAEIVTDKIDKLGEVHRRIEELDGVVRVCPAILIKSIK